MVILRGEKRRFILGFHGELVGDGNPNKKLAPIRKGYDMGLRVSGEKQENV